MLLVSATEMIADELKMYDPPFDLFSQFTKLNSKFPFIQLVLKWINFFYCMLVLT